MKIVLNKKMRSVEQSFQLLVLFEKTALMLIADVPPKTHFRINFCFSNFYP